jgi:hypothetical protein
MVIAECILIRPIPQLSNHLRDRLGPLGWLKPSAKVGHLLMKGLSSLSSIDIPHLLMQLTRLATTVPNLQKPMQETENGDNRGKEGHESVLSGPPIVSIDCFWVIVRV